MKLFYVSIVVAAVAALSSVGCGKSNDTPTTPNQVVTTGAVPVPGVPSPVNGQCPVGYVFNGSTCTVASNPGSYCTTGTSWNGYQCNYGGYQCPAGSNWSWQYNSCLYMTMPSGSYSYGNGFIYGNYYCYQPYGYYSGYTCYPYNNGSYYNPYAYGYGAGAGVGFWFKI